jgi:hypothetical protein
MVSLGQAEHRAMRLARTIAIMSAGTTCGVGSVRAERWDAIPQDSMRLDMGYHLATDGTQLGLVLGTVHLNFHHNYYLADPFVEVTSGAGRVSGGRTAHSIAARIGTEGFGYLDEFLFGDCSRTGGVCHAQLMGISTGLTIDGAGERIPEAWTIPVDAYIYAQTSDRTSLGPVGGVSWAFAGADRALGWRAGLDLVLELGRGHTALDPDHVHVGAGVQRLAGATFVGITLGIGLNRHEPESQSCAERGPCEE